MSLSGFFPYRLAIAAEGFSRSLSEVYAREYGLSREEWRLLFLLSAEKQVDSLALARATTLDKVQVSRASARLAERGLITREVHPRDRRLRLYEMTSAGRALFEELAPRVAGRAEEILSALDPEDRAALDRGLAALTAAVDTRRKG